MTDQIIWKLDTLITMSVLVELGAEVDSAGGVAVKLELDPGLDGSVLVEQSEGDLSLTAVSALVATVQVEDLDVEVVGDVGNLEHGVLVVPGGVLAAMLVDGGVPVLVVDLQVNHGVHLVAETTLVVLEVSGLQVHVDVAVARGGEDNDDGH